MRVGETKKFAYFDIFLKRWRAVYPSNKAPIGVKLCENAFQTIPVNSIFGEKKNVDDIFRSRTSFFAFFGQFWRIWRLTDLKINFLALFCFRCTYSGVCTTKHWRKNVCLKILTSKTFWHVGWFIRGTSAFCFSGVLGIIPNKILRSNIFLIATCMTSCHLFLHFGVNQAGTTSKFWKPARA